LLCYTGTMQKLYCYVDESGQDTEGKLFLVSVVIREKESRDETEELLLEIEKTSGKGLSKWQSTGLRRKVGYLEAVLQINSLKDSIFYATYETTKEYGSLTTYTIAKAVGVRASKPYQAIITIDGLNDAERDRVRRGLRQLGVRYKKVRGARDESSSLLRLADSLAGFLRDFEEGQGYTKEFFRRFMNRQIIRKLE
jgi:hypothetical protein